MPVPSNRNSAGQGSTAFYVVGVVCAAVGIYLSTITRINLLTGHTSSPYLGVGIPLAVVGILVFVGAQRAAKRNLTK
jgi:surface polysaccharide O-acyltransferase-like enzyme